MRAMVSAALLDGQLRVVRVEDGGPDNSSRFICYYIYTEAFENARMANACALGWVLFLMTGIFSILYFRMQSKWVNYA